jgi:hypothetical protein
MQHAGFNDAVGSAQRTLVGTGSTLGDLASFDGGSAYASFSGVDVSSPYSTFTARVAPQDDAAQRAVYTIDVNGAPRLQVMVSNGAYMLTAL